MALAIETQELTRIFQRFRRRWRSVRSKKEDGTTTALDRVSLKVHEGELFGLLGPNGAGKTTLIKILCTLLLPTSGRAFVAGFDVEKDPFPIRQRINMVSGGETSGYGLLTTRENIWMFSQFYGVPGDVAKERIDEALKVFGLWEKRDDKVRTLSSGQRQKMNMIRGFVTDPQILFLDEPTLGLDVNASRIIRSYVRNWVKGGEGKTVLLTTHYMREAEELCDRVAIIDQGSILACDSPENLKRLVKRESIFKLEVDTLSDLRFGEISGVKSFASKEDAHRGATRLTFVLDNESAVSDIVSKILHQGSRIHSLQKTEPTLEDVFVSMVGRAIE